MKEAQCFSTGATVALEISKGIIMEYLHNNIMQISISKHIRVGWLFDKVHSGNFFPVKEVH